MHIQDVIHRFDNKTQRTQTVVKNILGATIVKGCSILITLILIPVSIGYVSSELYGVWLALSTIIMWASLFDLGFGNGVRNKIAECMAIGDIKTTRQYISTSYVFFSIIFLPLSLIAYFICPYINWSSLLSVNVKYEEVLVSSMRIIIITFAITSIVKLLSIVLMAFQKNALSSLLDMLGLLLSLIVILALKYTTNDGSLIYLAYAMCVCPILVYIISTAWFLGIKHKELIPSLASINVKLVKDVVGLSMKFFVINISTVVLFYTMNLLISHVSGPSAVTEYNVIYKYMSIPLIISSIITTPYWTAYTDAFALKDYKWMQSSYKKLNLMCYYSIIGLLFLILIYPIVFKYWVGDLVDIHLEMIILVAIYVFIMIYDQVNANIINGIGKLRIHLILAVVSIIINIPLSLYLGNIFGTKGVVASVGFLTLLPAIILRIQIVKILNNRAIGIWDK